MTRDKNSSNKFFKFNSDSDLLTDSENETSKNSENETDQDEYLIDEAKEQTNLCSRTCKSCLVNCFSDKHYSSCPLSIGKLKYIFMNELVYILLIIITVPVLIHYYDKQYSKFDYYVFAQQWPSALCKEINETHHGKCSQIPKNVNSWVVHGLWPSKAHAHHHYGPFNCNDSWPFNPHSLNSIMPDLKTFWPNMMENTEQVSFWEHEWTKHGTCACQQDQIIIDYKNESPVKGHEPLDCHLEIDYFKKALKLRNLEDFDLKLKKSKILPSLSQTYNFSKIQKTLGSGRYQCYKTDKPNTQVLAQIMICYDKNFNRVSCEEYEGGKYGFKDFDKGPYNPMPCDENIPVSLLPIHMPMI